MSFFGDLRHTPAPTKPPGAAAVGGADPRVPLLNLANVHARMDSLQKFLSTSVTSNILLGEEQMGMVSTEISAAIHQIIVNGAALLASTQAAADEVSPGVSTQVIDHKLTNKRLFSETDFVDQTAEDGGSGGDDWEIIELDAVELLAEHIHFCEICGKGFKRDANLRMHMRAHGNQFKTPEALAKPGKCRGESGPARKTRFSCPFVGCSRNKTHKKFRPLKSAICVKNHFRRSHCPKLYSCNRCNKKSFSVPADLKSHAKHCGETKWKCSCGTSFSRKDKLFGHMALFEGHMPAVEDEKAAAVPMAEDDEEEEDTTAKKDTNSGGSDNAFLDRLLKDDCDSIDNYCFQEILGWPSPNAANGLGLETFFSL